MSGSGIAAVFAALLLWSGAPMEIPDGHRTGVMVGEVPLPAGDEPIDALILGVDVIHPYAADLVFRVHWDRDDDGTFDATAVVDLSAATTDPDGAEPPGACHVALDGQYFVPLSFGDAALEVGGSLHLMVADGEREDTGVLRGWSISVERRAPAGNEAQS